MPFTSASPLFVWHARSLNKRDMKVPGFSGHSRSLSCASHRCAFFWKAWVKPSVVIAAEPITSKVMHKMANRIREILSLHGGLALKLSVLVWTILVLAAVFFISKA
jgi:hypothetical protein